MGHRSEADHQRLPSQCCCYRRTRLCTAGGQGPLLAATDALPWLLPQADTTTKGTRWGTGGMATKLTAARIATAAGCHTVICRASLPENIVRVLDGHRLGTIFYPHPQALRWDSRPQRSTAPSMHCCHLPAPASPQAGSRLHLEPHCYMHAGGSDCTWNQTAKCIEAGSDCTWNHTG